jgi:hypothetical protein
VSTALLRRLPGFSFETRAPVRDDVLPRMDVALFAGFASSGPVNVPVPVEDAKQFADVFGADAPIAWNEEEKRVEHAQLGLAVRMFFANGGRRCWVIRLADNAETNTLAVPGIAAVRVIPGNGDLRPSFDPLALVARSPGSWADALSLSASLRTVGLTALSGLETESKEGARPRSTIRLATPRSGAPLKSGDLLRLTWPDQKAEMFVGIESATLIGNDSSSEAVSRFRDEIKVVAGSVEYFEIGRLPAQQSGTVSYRNLVASAQIRRDTSSPPRGAEMLSIGIDVARGDAPFPGEVIVGTFGSDEMIFISGEIERVIEAASPPAAGVVTSGKARWRSDGRNAPKALPFVELLSLDLWARSGDGRSMRIDNLGLAPGSDRHIEQLPDDISIYGRGNEPATSWPDVAAPRFPVAGSGKPRLCIPLGVSGFPETYLPARHSSLTALERDGIAAFGVSLFTDAALARSRATVLLANAEFERFSGDDERQLRGIHAGLSIDEATLISVPDAVHRGWVRQEVGEAPSPWAQPEEKDEACIKDDFRDCGPDLLPAPTIVSAFAQGDSVELRWNDSGLETFEIEEAATRDWRDVTVVYRGGDTSTTLTPRWPGVYYYRVRGVGETPSAWSTTRSVRVSLETGWKLRPVDNSAGRYSAEVLLAVHRLLLRFCAARRDVMAVLSLPRHYGEEEAFAHVRALGPANRPTANASNGSSDALIPEVEPLGFGEADAFSFAALYHGWLFSRQDGQLRSAAPDGAACGVIARRSVERGAWVAPANEILRDVIALDRPAPHFALQDLQQAQINVLRRTPRGFTIMSADTLSIDEDVRPINVRRLLTLLRRAAIRRGAGYVFEPNDDSFRRMVQRGFEAMLGEMFQRGAFAGRTSDQAFQVVTARGLNTPQSVDAGRFIVELRVAPARPLVFLTIQLTQIGERLTVTGS